MAGKLVSFIDRFVYAGDKQNPETRRKGRFFIVSTFAFLLLALSGTTYMLDEANRQAMSTFAGIINLFGFPCIVAVFFLYRKFGKRILWVHIISVFGFMSNQGSYESMGGIFSPDNLWGVIISAWIFLVADKISGIIWFTITFCTYAFFLYAQMNGYKDFKADVSKIPDYYYFINYGLACVFLCLIIFLHESGKEKYLKQLLTAKAEIEEQKKIVDEKNKDVTDSINYAKRIQEAIFPSKEEKAKLFPQSFVLFMPRDIVSGDFYWYEEKNGRKLIAAADCTGHGVPGAFMSMIGNAFLNEIVNDKGIVAPNEILDHLREQIIRSMKQTGAEGENKDGMDIALLSFDKDNRSVLFAGANNPLWLLRSGKIAEYKADKQPVGFLKGESSPFTTHEIKLQAGDALYIFTDGFADQFGGPKGKKFKYRQLQELMESVTKTPMAEQENIFRSKFESWKGTLEQIDDVLLIGIEIV